MKKLTLILIVLNGLCYSASAQIKDFQLNFTSGIALINFKGVKNSIQTGFSFEIPSKNKLDYQIGYNYMMGSHISRDKLDINPQQFNYQSHIQQSQINSLINYTLLNNGKINLQIQSGISFNFLKQSFVNNIYKKLIIPNSPLVLVSESTFKKKFQLGSISSLETSFKLKRFSPGILLQYQIQKEYQFFSPSVFISYKL